MNKEDENKKTNEEAKPELTELSINWNKVETLGELKLVLSCMGLGVTIEGNAIPQSLAPLHNLGLLIEKK